LLTKKNLEYSYSFVSDKIIDISFLQIPGTASIFPLYRYNGENNKYPTNYLFYEDDKKDNFTEKFREFIKNKYSAHLLDKNKVSEIERTIKNLQKELKTVEKQILSFEKQNFSSEIIKASQQIYEELKSQIEQKNIELKEQNYSQNSNYQPTPEEVFAYIYAILYSTTYRTKYAEFLKSDFPKIVFTENLDIFKKLVILGNNLIDIHLCKTETINSKFANYGIYKGKGDNIVSKIEYFDNKLYINQNQYFDNVPENIFSFYIGGYQVLDKYLKERKNRSIYSDFEQIETIVKIIANTIEIMQEIDLLTNNL